MLEMAGKWLIELSEIENYLQRRSVPESLQGFHHVADRLLSRTLRAPPGRASASLHSRCYHRQHKNTHRSNGTRRIWPVECGEIKIDEFKKIVDQLLAEARDCYRNGDSWYLGTEELEALAAAEQEERYEPGHWDDAILEWLENPRQRSEIDWDKDSGRRAECKVEPWDGTEKGKATIQDILIHGIGKTLDRIERRDRNSASRCLEHEKWQPHQARSGEQRGKRFYYCPQRFKEKKW